MYSSLPIPLLITGSYRLPQERSRRFPPMVSFDEEHRLRSRLDSLAYHLNGFCSFCVDVAWNLFPLFTFIAVRVVRLCDADSELGFSGRGGSERSQLQNGSKQHRLLTMHSLACYIVDFCSPIVKAAWFLFCGLTLMAVRAVETWADSSSQAADYLDDRELEEALADSLFDYNRMEADLNQSAAGSAPSDGDVLTRPQTEHGGMPSEQNVDVVVSSSSNQDLRHLVLPPEEEGFLGGRIPESVTADPSSSHRAPRVTSSRNPNIPALQPATEQGTITQMESTTQQNRVQIFGSPVRDPETSQNREAQNPTITVHLEKKKGKQASEITPQMPAELVGQKRADAAASLGVCEKTFKRIRSRYGISKWPDYRNEEQCDLVRQKLLIDPIQGAEGPFATNSHTAAVGASHQNAPRSKPRGERKTPSTGGQAEKAGSLKEETFTIKADYGQDTLKFSFSSALGISELKAKVKERLGLELGSFSVKYRDEDRDWVLVACDEDLRDCLKFFSQFGDQKIKLLITHQVVK